MRPSLNFGIDARWYLHRILSNAYVWSFGVVKLYAVYSSAINHELDFIVLDVSESLKMYFSEEVSAAIPLSKGNGMAE